MSVPPIDFAALAQQLVQMWPLVAPYLAEGAKKVGEGAASKLGGKGVEVVWEKIAERLQPKIKPDSPAQKASAQVLALPQDERAQGKLAARLEDIFEDDPALADELRPLMIIAQKTTNANLVIDGNARVEIKGSVVGKDQFNIDQAFFGVNPESLRGATAPELLRAYFRSLANECAQLPFGTIHARFLETVRETDVSVASVYIDLNVMPPARQEGEEFFSKRILKRTRAEPESQAPKPIPVLDALARDDLTRVVLLGDMGSGKSTCVQYLAYALAQRQAGEMTSPLLENSPLASLLPIRLILRRVAPHILSSAGEGNADIIWNALRVDVATRLKEVGVSDAALVEKLYAALNARLLREPALVLLDGLDEVPEAEARRVHLLQAIQKFVDTLPRQTRIVVTARPIAYKDPQWKLAQFAELSIEKFDNEQTERFIRRWYQAIRTARTWDEPTASGKAQELIDALDLRPDLSDLATRPLLLTLMATVASTWGTLPNDRFDLYEEMINLFLSRWQHLSEVRDENGKLIIEPGTEKAMSVPGVLREALNELAFNVHQRQRTEKKNDEPADISEKEILAVFAPHLADDTHPRVLLKYLDTRAGLLISRAEGGPYVFPHRSFQEYLAASWLSTRPNSPRALHEVIYQAPDWWREVFLWSAGIKSRGGKDSDGVVHLVNALVARAPNETPNVAETHYRAAVLAGLALHELKTKPRGEELFDAPYERVQKWLVQLIEGNHLTARERAEAGNTLARLVDPRPGVGLTTDGLPDLVFCEIPAGEFTMGGDGEYDGKPQFPYKKIRAPYFIARYPITNAQFDAFLNDSDGFQNKDWWKGLAQCDNQSKPPKQGGVYDLPNHPVVNVTWYQSVAFARWLDAKFQAVGLPLPVWREGRVETCDVGPATCRLPSEAEWEKAARGPSTNAQDARRYPWGNDPDPNRANYADTGIGATSAVGCFPDGASPYHVLDMSGNVWEWCATQWTENYKGYNETENNNLEGDARRVLRGGAFGLVSQRVRCAFRFGSPPVYRYYNRGVRVVLSPVL